MLKPLTHLTISFTLGIGTHDGLETAYELFRARSWGRRYSREHTETVLVLYEKMVAVVAASGAPGQHPAVSRKGYIPGQQSAHTQPTTISDVEKQ
jgi:hypothetical protein